MESGLRAMGGGGRDQSEWGLMLQRKAKGRGVTLKEGNVLRLEESGVTQRVQTRLDGDQGELTFSSQQGSEMTSVWRFR